jgi:hypothetical protein
MWLQSSAQPVSSFQQPKVDAAEDVRTAWTRIGFDMIESRPETAPEAPTSTTSSPGSESHEPRDERTVCAANRDCGGDESGHPSDDHHHDREDCDCDECNGACDCTGDVDSTWLEEHAPTVDTPTPDEIVELVESCIRFVKDALGLELDFTPETLPVLDHYLLAARESIKERSELRELLWRCAGAYFGELVRRRYNGFWHLPSADVHTWRIHQRQVLLSFNPVGVVAEAIAGSEDSDGPNGALRLARPDQEEIAQRLAAMPPLPEDEFYLLSTRLEVLDAVIEHLRVRMDQNDQADIEFDPEDYANDLQPYGRA